MLTIIYDPEASPIDVPSSSISAKGNMKAKGKLEEEEKEGKKEAPYKATPWCFGPYCYLNGAWCRLDMLYSDFTDVPTHSEKKKQER